MLIHQELIHRSPVGGLARASGLPITIEGSPYFENDLREFTEPNNRVFSKRLEARGFRVEKSAFSTYWVKDEITRKFTSREVDKADFFWSDATQNALL